MNLHLTMVRRIAAKLAGQPTYKPEPEFSRSRQWLEGYEVIPFKYGGKDYEVGYLPAGTIDKQNRRKPNEQDKMIVLQAGQSPEGWMIIGYKGPLPEGADPSKYTTSGEWSTSWSRPQIFKAAVKALEAAGF
jgi:hypothetical protein